MQCHDEDGGEHENGGGDVVEPEADPARRRNEGKPPTAIGIHLRQELIAEPQLRAVRADRRQTLRRSQALVGRLIMTFAQKGQQEAVMLVTAVFI